MQRDNTLKNAFNIVRKTHIELAELYKDFEAELKKYDLISIHSGSEVGTKRSKSLNSPEFWLFPYTGRYFAHKKLVPIRNWYVDISMINYNRSKDEPMIPRFLIGFAKKEIPYPGNFEYWWLVSMYESNYGREIFRGSKKMEKISDNEWLKIIPENEGGKGGEKWYDEGYLYSVPLTSISSKRKVNNLAKILSEKFYDISNI